MFGKKNALLLAEAAAKIKQQQDKLDWYQQHYEKQQVYIEELYDVVGDLSRQMGMVLKSENMERIHASPFLEDNSNFFLDLCLLFSTRFKKGRNVTCYYGKEFEELRRKFEDRDFKNSKIIFLTERLSLDDLRTLLRVGLWRKSVKDALQTIRSERKLETNQP
ncbi:MAG: hypothetical protein PHH91_09440 [Desulfuromonadaceae bacterium]|nr:hypothetical protein [Desulfuromonadaceae bacterium]